MSKEQDLYICEQFRSGKTVTELAKELECSYQNVHRVLKINGLGRTDGGKSKQVADRKAVAANSPTMLERAGCTPEQWDELRAINEDYKKTPLADFNTFKNNFQNLHPDISFEMTLWDWWTMWQQSGRWNLRKRNPEGMWIMAITNPELPFNKENARVIPFGQLLKEKRAAKKAA